jgi:hypothetical protein
MKISVKLLAAVVLVAGLLLSGCGVYTFNPAGKSSVGSLSVQPFENDTEQFGLADRVTELVIDAFIADGNIRIVPEDNAQAILKGTLTGYQRVANQFDENDQVQSYKVIMNFQISLIDPKDQTEIWTEPMNQQGIYDANNELEEQGQQRAAQRLVQAIIDKTTKSW